MLDNLVSAHTRGPGSMVETEVPMIAVLPFVVVTAGQETDHFADGLTDEVITDLSMIYDHVRLIALAARAAAASGVTLDPKQLPQPIARPHLVVIATPLVCATESDGDCMGAIGNVALNPEA